MRKRKHDRMKRAACSELYTVVLFCLRKWGKNLFNPCKLQSDLYRQNRFGFAIIKQKNYYR